MSTRATITVRDRKDGNRAFSIYRHCDGYPDSEHGVLEGLKLALSYAWALPRFEEDDFAAAIVAAWKKPAYRPSPGIPDYIAQGGNIRFTEGRDEHGNTEYHYEIWPDKDRIAVQCFERNGEDSWVTHGRVRYLTKAMQAPVVMAAALDEPGSV